MVWYAAISKTSEMTYAVGSLTYVVIYITEVNINWSIRKNIVRLFHKNSTVPKSSYYFKSMWKCHDDNIKVITKVESILYQSLTIANKTGPKMENKYVEA